MNGHTVLMPADRITAGRVPDADRPLAEDAVAAADLSLAAVLTAGRELHGLGGDRVDVAAALTQELLDDPAWTRLELACALGVAVADAAMEVPGG